MFIVPKLINGRREKNDHVHALMQTHARKKNIQIKTNWRRRRGMKIKWQKKKISQSPIVCEFNQIANKQQKKLSISNEISDCHRSSTLSLFYVVISYGCSYCCLIIVIIVSQFSELTHTNQLLLLFFFEAHIVALDLFDQIGLLASIVLYMYTVLCAICCLTDEEARLWREKNHSFRLVCRIYFSTLIIILLSA